MEKWLLARSSHGTLHSTNDPIEVLFLVSPRGRIIGEFLPEYRADAERIVYLLNTDDHQTGPWNTAKYDRVAD